MSVIIIGAGYTGLAAAWELCKAGVKVTVLEREDDIGGLAGTFELAPGVRLEKFYHHWFTSDTDVLRLIDELGLASSIQTKYSSTGIYYANSIFRLANPFDLLRFPGIPLMDRVRTGLLALYARTITNWHPLEEETALCWLERIGGRPALQVIWEPLLRGKFGDESANVSAVWIWNKLKLRGSSRNKAGKESLLYFAGGFGALTAAMRAKLESHGVSIVTGCTVTQIRSDHDAVHIATNQGDMNSEQLLCTTPLPVFLELAPSLPGAYRELHGAIRFLGNVCVVLRLDRSLSSTYWLNVADPSFPFVGVIEHTNFDPASNYGGEHIAYLSKYLPTTDPLFAMSDSEVLAYSMPFVKRIFPHFSPEWIRRSHVWRAHYSQPVTTIGYSRLIPKTRTPLPGVWLSTMAQIYPQDRGTNYAVRQGRAVALEMLRDRRG